MGMEGGDAAISPDVWIRLWREAAAPKILAACHGPCDDPVMPNDRDMADASPPVMSTEREAASVAAELIGVIVAVTGSQPRVLTIDKGRALPSGPFESNERSLQASLRTWVERQTHHPLGYMEQLYTFADPGRTGGLDRRVVSVSYLGLTREAPVSGDPGAGWRDWYRFFPWEDRRHVSRLGTGPFAQGLLDWVDQAPDAETRRRRHRRVEINFGLEHERWNEELILQRYETLWEARLVPEAGANGAVPGGGMSSGAAPGDPMAHDHRRILATGIARLRAKIKYRPVVFELMPPGFTLLQLQQTVEALAGSLLHKQNFRRLIDQQDLVEETGEMATETRGRPAKLFRFRREVLAERAVMGSKLPLVRAV